MHKADPEPLRMPNPPGPTRTFAWTWLVAAVIAASTAASLFRLVQLPALEAAGLRLLLAGLLLLPFGIAPLLRSGRPVLGSVALAGLALAVHFGSWVESLFLTSVASSVVLVTASPLFVLLFELLAREPVRRSQWVGAGVGLAGVVLIAGGDLSLHGRTALLGDGLALLGALAFSVYLRAGRRARQHLPVLGYAAPVYALAGLLLLAVQPLAGRPVWPLSSSAWLMTALLVLLPTLVGHTGFNNALREIRASTVAMVALLEPFFAVLLAWPLLHSVPSVLDICGGILAIGGLVLFERRAPKADPTPVP